MATKYMQITNEAEWLEKRKGYITSTQVSSLFGLNPYNTEFELYHTTRGLIDEAREENNFMAFGKLIEQPVCDMIKLEHPDWNIQPFPYFAYDDEDKIGSSFDRVVYISDKKYLLEIKSISYSQYKQKFIEHAADDIEASPHYECQMYNELELVKDDGFAGLVMAIFILDTRQLRYIFRTYDAEMGAALREAVRDFWKATEPPHPDFARDKSLISRLCPALDPNVQKDATGDTRITELAAVYTNAKALIRQEEDVADRAYAELLILIGNAKRVWTNGHKITVSDIKESQGTIITQEMVGTVIGARKSYKRLTVTETKKESDYE